ncbi:MAG: hypothetical protein DRO11_00205 [Methanobacteriota archaeon]|nr:MAG: hypothetical protein DRO11_00205 [Euryarchaeota archaeon]
MKASHVLVLSFLSFFATLICVITFPAMALIPSMALLLLVLLSQSKPPARTLLKMDEKDAEILKAIYRGARTIRSISLETNFSWSTTSKRIEKLIKIGLVSPSDEFSLTPKGEEIIKTVFPKELEIVSS